MAKSEELIKGKRILVTGGTGSFGKMFISKILDLKPKEIIVFSRDEDKQGDMRLQYKDNPVMRFVIGDIRDFRSINSALRNVDIVFHAAALKWVTEVEMNVWEGIKTNVIGAQNIIEAALNNKVKKVVALSTDKAVEPINAYGQAKALQERLMTTANLYTQPGETVFVNTRYGNVLGSRGSVVPYFKSLLAKGKKLTITDKNMTRFLMTLDESVDLVLKALEEGVGGEVFVRKAPGHTIQDLAEVVLESEGKSNDSIEYIGVRPGEKIHEALIGYYETSRTIDMDDYLVVLPQIDIPAIKNKYSNIKTIKNSEEYSSNNAKQMTKTEIKSVLSKEGWI